MPIGGAAPIEEVATSVEEATEAPPSSETFEPSASVSHGDVADYFEDEDYRKKRERKTLFTSASLGAVALLLIGFSVTHSSRSGTVSTQRPVQVAAPPPVTEMSNDNAQFLASLDRCQALQKRRRFESAISCYRNLGDNIFTEAGMANTYNDWGVERYTNGDYEAAYRLQSQALEMKPSDGVIANNARMSRDALAVSSTPTYTATSYTSSVPQPTSDQSSYDKACQDRRQQIGNRMRALQDERDHLVTPDTNLSHDPYWAAVHRYDRQRENLYQEINQLSRELNATKCY